MPASALLPWQYSAWQHIANAMDQQRLSHAMLLSGLDGIGKRHFANILAQMLLCLNPVKHQACGICKACALYSSGNHPDVLVLEPEEEGLQIKVDDVRSATEFMQKTAQQGGAKVLIIAPAEAMNINAANALLKTLEEPGRNSYLILVTHSISRLLATVRSRCRRYELTLPSQQQAYTWLLSQGVEPQQAEDALLLAARRPLLAKHLIVQQQLKMHEEVLDNIHQLLLGQTNFLELTERWIRYDFLLLTQYLCGCLNDMIKWCLLKDLTVIQNKKLLEFYADMQKNNSLEKLFNLYQYTLEVRDQGLSKANIARQLLIENLLLQWQTQAI